MAAPDGETLTVEHLDGSAARNRLGAVDPLKPGDTVAQGDVVVVRSAGRLLLGIAGGQFELGADAELGVEKLPEAAAPDPNTILDLRQGFLRVVWDVPPAPAAAAGSSQRPLFVYFGAAHAALAPGEYFIDSRNGLARACVAAGSLALVAAPAPGVQTLDAAACYRFIAGLPPEQSPRDADSWSEIRASLSIDAPSSPEALLAQNDAEAAAAANLAPALPVIPPAAADKRVGAPSPPAHAAASAAPRTDSHAQPPPAPAAADWVVNVGAFAEAGQARKLAAELRGGGFPVALQTVQVRGQTLWRVQLRGYRSAEAGRAAALALGKRFGLKNLWVAPALAAAPAKP
jgi:cell division septation protein DedD